MSRRKLLMRKKINEARAAGKDPLVVIPKNMKRKSLMSLFKQKEN